MMNADSRRGAGDVRWLQRLCVAVAALALGGCAALYTAAQRVTAQARSGQLQAVAAFDGTPMRAWLRQPPAAATADTTLTTLTTITIYIEGDGAEWRGKYEPPRDPTPDNPLTLRLALRDPGASVAYLGRPCQYLDDAALAQCPSLLWMQGRYGEPAVTMMSAAVDLLLLAASAQRVRLVGYSGGGVMAALIAAQRHGCVVPGDRRLAAGYRCLDSGDRCVTANGVAESARTRTASGHHRANPHRGRRRRTGAYPRATTLYHRAAASQTGSVARF